MKQKDMLLDKLNQFLIKLPLYFCYQISNIVVDYILKNLKEKTNKMIEDTQIKLDHQKKKNEITILEQKKAYDILLKLACDDKRDKEILVDSRRCQGKRKGNWGIETSKSIPNNQGKIDQC